MSKIARVIVRAMGRQDYEPVWRRMSVFTDSRDDDSDDELWLVEHNPVFTQGQAGKAEHLISLGKDIPLVQSDRGGQVTYHGPGQLVAYPLLNLRRLGLGVRDLVTIIETSVVRLLAEFDLEASAKPEAPGVYVEGRKIASLGLRVRRGCSFHGVAINYAMDLAPFQRINPCGYPGLEMVQLSDLVDRDNLPSFESFQRKYVTILASQLGFEDKALLYSA